MDPKLNGYQSQENGPKKATRSLKYTFVLIHDVNTLLPTLEDRLPLSSYVYNMIKFYPKYQDDMKFYILEAEGVKPEDKWIVATNFREDYHLDIAISTNENPVINSAIKDAFLVWDAIDWSKIFAIISDRKVTPTMTDICLTKGVRMLICPCCLYVHPEDGRLLEKQTPVPQGVEVKNLISAEGLAFFIKTWKYGIEGSDVYIRKLLERNPSIGCFVDGKIVSGALTYGTGLIGMLYTEKEYRNKQLGKICMEKLILEFENAGIKPCSTVEHLNTQARIFHEKLGMKAAGQTDFILRQIGDW